MAEADMSHNGDIHNSAHVLEVNQHQKMEELCPRPSCDSQSDQESSLGLGLDSRQEEQIEKLKEFLSEAAMRGDDAVTQSDADTVKALENLENLKLWTKPEMAGLGARLESAARANLEIQNQASSGYYPSETVYLEDHTLKDVLEETVCTSHLVQIPSNRASPRSSENSPLRPIDAESALKDELDCLFQERAARFRTSP